MSDNERLRGRELATAFSGLLLAMLLSALDATIVATALPTIVGELGGLERLGWVVTAYLLAQTVVTPIFGKLGDLYGRKVVLQSAIGLFLVGSALCGAAGSMGQLIAFRALQGLGGGGLGTAVFGAIFAAGLTDHLAAAFPGGAPTAALGSGVSPEVLERLPAVVRDVYVEGVATSLSTVFLIAMFIAIAGFALTWMVPEQPLRETIAAAAGDVGAETEQVFPLPTDTDSISKLERFLSLLASRDLKREYIHSVVARARADISPLAAWLLVRIDRDPETQPEELARRYDIDSARLAGAAAELRDRGLVAEVGNGGAPPRRIPTAPGTTVLRRLAAARRARLAEVLGEWAPEQRQELVRRLRRLTKDIVVDGSGA